MYKTHSRPGTLLAPINLSSIYTQKKRNKLIIETAGPS